MDKTELINIVEPLAAEAQHEPNLLLIAVIVVIASLALAMLIHFFRRRQARAWIVRLRADYVGGRRDAGEVAYLLADGLRHQLGLRILDEQVPPSGLEAAVWREFVGCLSALRYEPTANAQPAGMEALFCQALRCVAEARC